MLGALPLLPLLPLLLLTQLLGCARGSQGPNNYEATVRIADAKPLRDLPAFWSSTGFSAPSAEAAEKYLLSEEMEWNLAYIGASPRAAVRQVRAHWLLQLIRASPHSSGWRWNFSLLDRFLDRLALNGLEPGFEIMGNPAVVVEAAAGEAKGGVTRHADAHARPQRWPLITDITEQAQLWARLVRDTVVHCGERYGAAAVSRWRFETWNEPDLKMYNLFNWTVDGYMAYLSATVRGLREAEGVLGARLRLGGPAGTFKARARHPICWHVLEHCDRMASRNQSCGLDFITFHRKGNASARSVASETLRLLDQFGTLFPHLRRMPFANDEADPLTGWWREEAWRADGRYAGMVVNTVIDLQDQWRGRSGPVLEILSNDNGFLETTPRHFEQRTLLSSFQMGGAGQGRGPPQLFRKSVLTAMAMLSFLEGEQLSVQFDSQPAMEAPLRLAALASLAADRSVLSLLIAFTNETAPADAAVRAGVHLAVPAATVAALAGPHRGARAPAPRAASLLVRVSFLDGDPSGVWRAAGSPPDPGVALRQLMRRAELPRVARTSLLAEGADLSLTFDMTLGCISLVQVFSPQRGPLLRVRRLRAMNVSYNEVLVLWADDERQSSQVVGYEIRFRRSSGELFRVLRTPVGAGGGSWALFPCLHYAPTGPAHSPSEQTRGEYRVAAVDVWGRVGPGAHVLYP